MKTLNYLIILLFFASCSQSVSVSNNNEVADSTVESADQEETNVLPKFVRDSTLDYSNLSDSEWKKILNEKEYYVLREKGTERAFTGDYVDFKEKGTFLCRGCGTKLFSSKTKFKSGTGWPSFYDKIGNNVIDVQDNSYGMVRTESVCVTCKGHLGHVFTDGPNPTGLRYCINSVSLAFEAEK